MSVITIPLDATQVADADRSKQSVKVAIQQGTTVKSQVVSVKAGKAQVQLEADPKQAASIAVGPETATDDDMFHLQTLTASVTVAQLANPDGVTISPIVITPSWWSQWLIWCREFTITGRVLCANGSPVPAAEVTAFDVDYFWWWSSLIQVGTAITDSSGHFTIKFRWCCGWFPWWWWRLRQWRLDFDLLAKIQPVVKLNPAVKTPAPGPIPSLAFSTLNPQPLPPRSVPTALASTAVAGRTIDPTAIPALRDTLIKALPQVPELERLRIWPWWPWTPWFDCSPSIIFRATQNCGGNQPTVIVNETIFDTRWDIPTTLDVTLVANAQACCLPGEPTRPAGDCALFTGVCGDAPTSIGTTGVLAGFFDPGGRDRPFAEGITLSGQFGTGAQANYYLIEYTPHGTNAWAQLPVAALQGFSRQYYDSTQVPPNSPWFSVPVPVQTFGAYSVYMSREYYETTHPPANWGNALSGRTWYANVDTIASIQTNGILPDGAYDFRIVGFQALANQDLDPSTRKVLGGCGDSPNSNLLVLFFDNRIVGPATPGTVHVDTTEPDCGITGVSLGGVAVQPCGAQQLQPGTPLEIDFFATDPDGHLDHYDLTLQYGLGSIEDLLGPITGTTSTLSVVSGGPQGPDYSNAVATPQNAVRPIWKGGSMKLVINDASKVFPQTCCYLITLTVWKRNIVSCDGSLTYYNQMTYSFTVTV